MDIPYVRNLVREDNLRLFVAHLPKTTKRNYFRLAKSLGTQLLSMFFDKVAEKLLDSDRIIFNGVIKANQTDEMYIGDANTTHYKYLNQHTDGKIYRIIMPNYPNIRIKFSYRNKAALANKLQKGQPFY